MHAKPEAPLLLFQWTYANILVNKQQNPSAQVTEPPLARPATGSRPAGIDHAPRKERQGVAFPTSLTAPWSSPPQVSPAAVGLPTQWQAALPAGHRGTVLCFPSNTHFHSQQSWDYERRQFSQRPRPLCNGQSDRGAPRTNLADSRGSHPTRIWTSVYWW